jgi:DNA topoisomerase-1
VESPAKAKTIKNFLGSGYEVIASKGHIRDLPKSTFGIKIEDGKFVPQYCVGKDSKEIAKQIQAKAKTAKKIFIATDEDREGEAIGYHIAKIIKQNEDTIPRIVFHEITKTAINNAISNPQFIDMNQVNAQQARRLLDRIVGYKLSPLLSSKIQRGLSAGRVQSSALKIIIDKQREIDAFKPVEYHTINVVFKDSLEVNLVEYAGKKIDKLTINNQEFADEIVDVMQKQEYIIDNIEFKTKKTKPSAPFMTSTLQQTASSMIGMSPRRTMSIAQKLYEGIKIGKETTGLITYMRTDSLNIAKEAITFARDYIKSEFGANYLPSSPRVYTTKNSSAQEAHEAIRPTRIDLEPSKISQYLKPEEAKLYQLIYQRFVASQMSDASFLNQTITIKSDKTILKLNGRKMEFDGFYKVLNIRDKDKLLPALDKNQIMVLQNKISSTKNFTQPPPKYSEASLIKALESKGIGRPSTYAPTISILQARDYIELENKQINPTEIAIKVIKVLEEHFANIVDCNFTANMEKELDDIAQNKKDWQQILVEFYDPFIKKIDDGKQNIKSQKVVKMTDEICPDCGEPIVIRKGRFGEFKSCSTYPKCKFTANISGDKKEIVVSDKKCDKCGKDMVVKKSRNGEFLACSGYPKCKNTQSLTPDVKLDTPCPKCGGDLIEKKSKRGVFYGCKNYPDCKFLSKFPITNTKCDKCDDIMAKRVFKNKDILECINSKCKNRVDV